MAYTILVAEDEKPIADVIEFLLTDAGYKVVLAHDGIQALKVLEELTPDLIILDVMMPGKDGFDVAKEARKISRLNHCHFLFLTALGDQQSKMKGYATGAEQYLTKPFDNNDLLDRIQEILK